MPLADLQADHGVAHLSNRGPWTFCTDAVVEISDDLVWKASEGSWRAMSSTVAPRLPLHAPCGKAGPPRTLARRRSKSLPDMHVHGESMSSIASVAHHRTGTRASRQIVLPSLACPRGRVLLPPVP